jgi:thiamine-phosphate pyrophosphorylase
MLNAIRPMNRPVPDLRLIVVTDAGLAAPRRVADIVAQALDAGAPAIQLRDKQAPARELAAQAAALLPLVRAAGALLVINDRVDVALAVGADGVHIGPHDIPVEAARRIAPPHFLIGYSTDDPGTARAAERAGASYIGCGAVFGTTTKQEVAGEQIGTHRLDEVACAVKIPVVGIGGIGPDNIESIAGTAASGAAVVGAVMRAEHVGEAVRVLLRVWDSR